MHGSGTDKPAIPEALVSFNPEPDAFGPYIVVVPGTGFCSRESLDDLDTLRDGLCVFT